MKFVLFVWDPQLELRHKVHFHEKIYIIFKIIIIMYALSNDYSDLLSEHFSAAGVGPGWGGFADTTSFGDAMSKEK
jgi:hypothetical protein